VHADVPICSDLSCFSGGAETEEHLYSGVACDARSFVAEADRTRGASTAAKWGCRWQVLLSRAGGFGGLGGLVEVGGDAEIAQAQCLQREVPAEQGVVDQVSLPEPAGLGAEAVEPFEADASDPSRGLLLEAGVEVEGGAHADHDGGMDAAEVPGHP